MLDDSKMPFLIRAVQSNNVEIVNILLSLGVDPLAKGIHGEKPIEMAYRYGFFEIVDLLIDAESKMFD